MLHYRNINDRRPLSYKCRHVILEWDKHRIMFTVEELKRSHLKFMHSSANKQLDLIKRAKIEATSDSVNIMGNQRDLQTCQECKSVPLIFNACFPSDTLVFNRSNSIDWFSLDNEPILHVIDYHIGSRNETFLRSKPFHTYSQNFSHVGRAYRLDTRTNMEQLRIWSSFGSFTELWCSAWDRIYIFSRSLL